VSEEVCLLVDVVGDVIVGVVHVLLQDGYIELVELGVAGLILLALLEEQLQVLEVVLLQLSLLVVYDPLPLLEDAVLVNVHQISIVGNLLVLQFV
jgi:hypothetical protein